MKYPRMIKLTQKLDDDEVGDIDQAVKEELEKVRSHSIIRNGSRVALTAGSRGICNISLVLRALVRELKKVGAKPFVVPAMGSHGGASAEGQKAILTEYGITETGVGAPIISSMEVVELGMTPSGIPVRIDRAANDADHIVVVNRIKPHTEFQGEIESGLLKMMVIGMGKLEGTAIAHRFAVKYGYERTIREMGQYIMEKAPVAMGVGIIENGYGRTAQITATVPKELIEVEKKLLQIAKQKTPKLPFDRMDILIIDECGKEISGTGMDTKVIGRIMNIYELEVASPKITRIILRDLTEKTHGNAIGVGLADFVTRRVADKMDCRSTYVNSVTAITPEKGRLPVVCENDKEALDFAIATSGPLEPSHLRMVWIKNTSSLGEMLISAGLREEARHRPGLTIDHKELTMTFGEDGNLMGAN